MLKHHLPKQFSLARDMKDVRRVKRSPSSLARNHLHRASLQESDCILVLMSAIDYINF